MAVLLWLITTLYNVYYNYAAKNYYFSLRDACIAASADIRRLFARDAPP